MRSLILFITGVFCACTSNAQVVLNKPPETEKFSVVKHVSLADAGHGNYSIKDIAAGKTPLHFKKLSGNFGHLGFTDHTYWASFTIENSTAQPIFYYLEAGVAMTDRVTCFLSSAGGGFTRQLSGDEISFKRRSVKHRDPLFNISLKPHEKKQVFLEIRNDGERNLLPINLLSEKYLFQNSYLSQIKMGFFYGMLLIICITYLFFFLAINERSFLVYSLYVLFVGLCQFSLDGLFHQYISPNGSSWLSLHAVILSAIFAAYFFGRYSELVLNIREKLPFFHTIFRGLYILLGLVMVAILMAPPFLRFSYPIVNILTLGGMILIFATIGTLLIKGEKMDVFYMIGIGFLFFTILASILSNFGVISPEISSDDITKLGIGLENIALSLSMANRIRLLKSAKENLQTIALQRSHEINDMRSFFLSNMSHELRTPLNAILGTSNIMDDEAANPAVKSQIEIIKNASNSLIASINDILDFSLIERGELKLDNSPFKPYKILQQASKYAERKARGNGLDYRFVCRFDPDITVLGDASRLGQIIQNILSNAVKFTLSGFVEFKAEGEVRNSHIELKLTFTDTGVGISKEKLAVGFGLFSQSMMDNKRRFGGFGIGLSVVNALVTLHKGQFDVQSELEKGSVFTIKLDYAVAATHEATIIELPHVSQRNYHILVVEDNPVNQMVVKMILKKWDNISASYANDGAEALKMMQEKHVDLVLLDLQMPVMDGYETLTAIRTGEAGLEHSSVPVIVLTADVMETTKERVFALGANEFMTKPVDKNLLYDRSMALLTIEMGRQEAFV